MSGLVSPVSGTEKISPNIVFLLIILQFHMMHPDHTHFPALPGLPSSCAPSLKNPTSLICVAHILIGAWHTPTGQPLKENYPGNF